MAVRAFPSGGIGKRVAKRIYPSIRREDWRSAGAGRLSERATAWFADLQNQAATPGGSDSTL